MRRRRIVESDRQEFPASSAGALPCGAEFDAAGRAIEDDAIVATLASLAFRRTEGDLRAMLGERPEFAGVSVLGLVVGGGADNRDVFLSRCETTGMGLDSDR